MTSEYCSAIGAGEGADCAKGVMVGEGYQRSDRSDREAKEVKDAKEVKEGKASPHKG